ncbi:MAG: hypothetical protein J6R85_02435 [Lentisphaeria bacterium]|nr:hypothetical protein [Lentisphaeria bacterium]
MKKLMFLSAMAAAAVLFTGCVSVNTVEKTNLNGERLSLAEAPVAHINVQNWGIYLLHIPLLTGSTEAPGSIAVFKDTVNAQSVLPVLTAESKKLGAKKTLDIASQYSESGLLIVSRQINMSGNAVK